MAASEQTTRQLSVSCIPDIEVLEYLRVEVVYLPSDVEDVAHTVGTGERP